VKAANAKNLKSTGALSAEIQESLSNFKVVIAFNRRDYFRKRFQLANLENYRTAIAPGWRITFSCRPILCFPISRS
jgi:ATP-binding cassette subfamily B protein